MLVIKRESIVHLLVSGCIIASFSKERPTPLLEYGKIVSFEQKKNYSPLSLHFNNYIWKHTRENFLTASEDCPKCLSLFQIQMRSHRHLRNFRCIFEVCLYARDEFFKGSGKFPKQTNIYFNQHENITKTSKYVNLININTRNISLVYDFQYHW